MQAIAIVGTGNISRAHIAGYGAFPQSCRIVALHDIVESRAHATKEQLGLDGATSSAWTSCSRATTSTW